MAMINVKGIEMYSKQNTLKDRAAEYASTQIFRALAKLQAEAEVAKWEETLRGYKNTEGTMAYPGDEKVKEVAVLLAEAKLRLEGVSRLPEAKFSFTADADKALRKEWKVAETDTLRGVALAHWFQAQGCPCADTNSACFELGQWLKGLKKTNMETVIMDGEDWETRKTTVPFADLMRTVIDWCFDLSLMREDMYPQELKGIYTQKREQAKARREARKNKKARKSQSVVK